MRRQIVKRGSKYGIRQTQLFFWITYVDLTNSTVAWFLNDEKANRYCWSTNLKLVEKIADGLIEKISVVKEIK